MPNLTPKRKRGRPRKDPSNKQSATIATNRYPKRGKTNQNYEESEVESEYETNNDANALPGKFPTKAMSATNLSSKSDKNSESEDEWESMSDSETENSNANSQKYKIVESKELIQFRTDNIVYFVSSNGQACDKGAKKLLESSKIKIIENQEVGEVQHSKRKNNRYYFSLCIRGESPESLVCIKNNIKQTMEVLRDLLIKLNQEEFSISKSEYIENLDWKEVLSIIRIIFEKTNIKVIICNGTLEYVPFEKRDEIFYELHKSPIGGHKGVSKTYNRIKQSYFWENLKLDVQRRIQQCLECQLKKLVRLKTKQPMVITDTPGTVFEKIAMDIVGPLKASKNGNEYILTMQDQLSKFCLAVPLQNTLASTIADAFIKKLICVFGAPKVVLTDQGKNFLSNLMSRVAKRFRIKKIRTTAFHPQANGSLERSHHSLGEFLKQYITEDEEWDEWIDVAMLNYNTCVQESTKLTPYEVVFGRLARLPSNDPLREGDLLPTYKGYVESLVTRLNGIQKLAYDNLVSSKFRSKRYYDQKLNPKNFKIGDYVFLLNGPKPGKFGNHYSGPYKILEILNQNNIKIQIKNKSKIVHTNRLRISHINHESEIKKSKPRKKSKENG